MSAIRDPIRVLRWLLRGLAVAVFLLFGYVAVQAADLGATWSSIERVSLETGTTGSTTPERQEPEASEPSSAVPSSIAPPTRPSTYPSSTGTDTAPPAAPPFTSSSPPPSTAPSSTSSPSLPEPTTTSSTTTTTTATTQPSDEDPPAPSVLALVGSDSRAGLDDTSDFGDFAGQRADVIVLAMRDGEEVALVSVPRDLYVEDLCNGGHHRINEAFAGCGDINGLAQLVSELENVTELDIDHAAAVDLAGFQEVVDLIGGYEICTDFPLRDSKSGLDLDRGCITADGETTLQWLRSRYTERLVDGSWEQVSGVSDLTRNRRQRQFLADLLQRQAGENDPRQLIQLAEAVAPHLTVDDGLSLADAASWVWDYRGANPEMAELPVTYRRTEGGASVLVAEGDLESFIRALP